MVNAIISQDKTEVVIVKSMDALGVTTDDKHTFRLVAETISDQYILGEYPSESMCKEILMKLVTMDENTYYQMPESPKFRACDGCSNDEARTPETCDGCIDPDDVTCNRKNYSLANTLKV